MNTSRFLMYVWSFFNTIFQCMKGSKYPFLKLIIPPKFYSDAERTTSEKMDSSVLDLCNSFVLF